MLRNGEIRYHEMELIDGMDPKFPGSSTRFNKTLNLGHRFLLTYFGVRFMTLPALAPVEHVNGSCGAAPKAMHNLNQSE